MKSIYIFSLVLIYTSAHVNGALPGVKTNEVKLKVLADQLFDNLLATKDQVSNKTRMSELKTVFDKIKQNPIRFFDLMITIGKNNKALSDEAMKIIDFSQFDQCITMLIDLILQRLDYWMQLKSSTTTSATTISGMTMTVNTGTSATSTISPATGTVAPPQTTSSTTITITTPTIPTTTVTYTTPPIFSDIVLIDPLYCNNYNLTNCAIVAGQPLNLIPFICKSMCACQGSLNCGGHGIPVLNSTGNCVCVCNDGYSGASCQNSDREFCFLSLKPSCTDPYILLACPSLCSS